jgi:hypothetical protein
MLSATCIAPSARQLLLKPAGGVKVPTLTPVMPMLLMAWLLLAETA